jgi:uncharacterized DUF497 family protein
LSSALIADFLFDDENEAEMARHGLTARRVLQVLDDEYIMIPNRRARRAAYLLIGHDHGGAFITIPVEPTHDPGVWRPVTAWPSKRHERDRLV